MCVFFKKQSFENKPMLPKNDNTKPVCALRAYSFILSIIYQLEAEYFISTCAGENQNAATIHPLRLRDKM